MALDHAHPTRCWISCLYRIREQALRLTKVLYPRQPVSILASERVRFSGDSVCAALDRHGFLKPPMWDRQGIGHVTTRHHHKGRSSPNSTSFIGACSSLYDVQSAPPMWLIATGTVSASRSLTCPSQTLRAFPSPIIYTRSSQWGPQWGPAISSQGRPTQERQSVPLRHGLPSLRGMCC